MDAPHVFPAVAAPEALEPLERVLELDHRRGRRWGLWFGFATAIAVHGTAGTPVIRSFPYLTELTRSVRQFMADRLRSQVDIDVDKPPPPPPPPPPEEKEPEPPPPVAHAAPPPPHDAPAKAPAAAEAGKVLTAEPDPDEPVDLTGDGFVSGNGDRFAGGVTATRGTAKSAVRSLDASPTGTGSAPRAVAAPASTVNLSRPPGLPAGSWSDCGFPAEADAEGINNMRVKLSVTVKADGHVRSATVLADPGYGFAAMARQCAMRKVFTPALNAAGEPVEQTMPPFTVHFER
jgi:protein TonB